MPTHPLDQSGRPAPDIPQTPTPAAPPPAAAVPSLDALRVQEQVFMDRLTIMSAQRQVLIRQLRSGDPALRAAAAPEMTQLSLRIVQTQADLDRTRALIQERQGGAPQPRIIINPRAFQRGPDGDQITAIVIVFTLAVLMPISIGILRRMWRRNPGPSAQPILDNISPRLDRLETAVDAIAVEVERISEGQRFVTKVLAERPVAAPLAQPVRERGQDLGAAGAGDAKPFLALGAGPIEPIRMAERQAVRASITPH